MILKIPKRYLEAVNIMTKRLWSTTTQKTKDCLTRTTKKGSERN
jgi:hypothetical protein